MTTLPTRRQRRQRKPNRAFGIFWGAIALLWMYCLLQLVRTLA